MINADCRMTILVSFRWQREGQGRGGKNQSQPRKKKGVLAYPRKVQRSHSISLHSLPPLKLKSLFFQKGRPWGLFFSCYFNQSCENKSEICRKFWILWKLFTIFEIYSLHSVVWSTDFEAIPGGRPAWGAAGSSVSPSEAPACSESAAHWRKNKCKKHSPP